MKSKLIKDDRVTGRFCSNCIIFSSSGKYLAPIFSVTTAAPVKTKLQDNDYFWLAFGIFKKAPVIFVITACWTVK